MKYTARVVPGRGEGRKLGFPTLNLAMPDGFITEVKQGIYAARVWIDEKEYPAAIHYGPMVMFGVQAATLEVHVIDTDIPTAPRELAFELVKYLREVKDFKDSEALVAQMHEDVKEALKALEYN